MTVWSVWDSIRPTYGGHSLRHFHFNSNQSRRGWIVYEVPRRERDVARNDQDFERGEFNVSLLALAKLCCAAGVKLSALLDSEQ